MKCTFYIEKDIYGKYWKVFSRYTNLGAICLARVEIDYQKFYGIKDQFKLRQVANRPEAVYTFA